VVFDIGKIPTGKSVGAACRICEERVKFKELDDSMSVFFRRSVLVLFPFLKGGVGDSKSQSCSQLRHGKMKVNPLLAEVFAKSLWIGWVVP
jgi:hypothetical protein